MYLDQDDVCDTGLALGLTGGSTHNHHHQERGSSLSKQSPLRPSLTLSLSDDAPEPATTMSIRPSSPNSTSSSSKVVKTEKKDIETERVWCRVSVEDDEGSARKKLRLTRIQSAMLEERFNQHTTLNPRQKQTLAKQLNLRPRQVEVWFQNRRARIKLKQTEMDCELLKRCCEKLSDENKRLQKELHELRALEVAPPPSTLYMQPPAATLAICPSCGGGGGGGGGAKGGAPKPRFFNPFTHPAAC